MSLPKYSAGGKSMRQPIKGESQPLFHFSRLRAFINIVEQPISVSYLVPNILEALESNQNVSANIVGDEEEACQAKSSTVEGCFQLLPLSANAPDRSVHIKRKT